MELYRTPKESLKNNAFLFASVRLQRCFAWPLPPFHQQLRSWWVQQLVSVSSCSARRRTGSLAVLCEDRSMTTEWRGKPDKWLALGNVTLPAMMDRQVDTLHNNQVPERCSERGAEERAGTQGWELHPAQLWKSASGK